MKRSGLNVKYAGKIGEKMDILTSRNRGFDYSKTLRKPEIWPQLRHSCDVKCCGCWGYGNRLKKTCLSNLGLVSEFSDAWGWSPLASHFYSRYIPHIFSHFENRPDRPISGSGRVEYRKQAIMILVFGPLAKSPVFAVMFFPF